MDNDDIIVDNELQKVLITESILLIIFICHIAIGELKKYFFQWVLKCVHILQDTRQ